MPQLADTAPSKSRKVRAYVKAERQLHRLDDQLRRKLEALGPLRERVRRASDLAWTRWQAMNVAQQKEATTLVGPGRKTVLREGAPR